MTHTTTHPFDREILFTPRRSDFVYDVFVGTEWVASARYQGAGDLIADEVCYAHVLAHPVIDPDTLVIRAAAPAQLAACVADTPRCASCGSDGDCRPNCDTLTPIGPCYVCGNPAWEADATGPLCPEHANILALFEGTRAVRPIAADALLAEADAALGCPGTGTDMGACGNPITATGFCARCTRFLDRVFVASTTVAADAPCSLCGEAHADAACPQRQSVLPTVQPTHCGNCGGQHSIQQCSDIRRLLFAA